MLNNNMAQKIKPIKLYIEACSSTYVLGTSDEMTNSVMEKPKIISVKVSNLEPLLPLALNPSLSILFIFDFLQLKYGYLQKLS
jgi:hypothetical protein